MNNGQVVAAQLDVKIGQIVLGVHHARIDPRCLQVGLQGQVALPHFLVDQTEVVVALGSLGIDLNAAPQNLNSFVELLHSVVHGA